MLPRFWLNWASCYSQKWDWVSRKVSPLLFEIFINQVLRGKKVSELKKGNFEMVLVFSNFKDRKLLLPIVGEHCTHKTRVDCLLGSNSLLRRARQQLQNEVNPDDFHGKCSKVFSVMKRDACAPPMFGLKQESVVHLSEQDTNHRARTRHRSYTR